MIYELRILSIDASEEGGNPLTDSPAVQLILSLLTLADHPGDTAARFHVATSPLGAILDYTDHADAEAACRLAERVRCQLGNAGYGPTLYDWTRRLADACDRRDWKRLTQLVSLAYTHDAKATTRPGDFIRMVEQTKVEDPTSARVRVMNIHQSKGLQFDIVVLPELDARLVGQTPQITIGRSSPTGPIERVCRYVSKDLRPLLPGEFCQMFDDDQQRVVEEALCVLYVAITRAVHALHMIVAPSRATEKNLPTTFAGLLRGALTDGRPLAPGEIAYEHGDPQWFEETAAPKEEVNVITPALTTVRLAAAPKHRNRGLDRRSPAQLEGADAVCLAHQLRLDSTAMQRGTLLHDWLSRIEWLETGVPDPHLLCKAGEDPAYRGLDIPAQLAFFHQALQKPAISAVFTRAAYKHNDVQVWRERSFAVRDGDAILNGNIDRLVVLLNDGRPIGADILDFKTDQLAACDTAVMQARVDYYRPQLEAYRRAVSAMFHLSPAHISARLVFLEPGVVQSID